MVEQQTVDSKDSVRFSVVDDDPIAIKLSSTWNRCHTDEIGDVLIMCPSP